MPVRGVAGIDNTRGPAASSDAQSAGAQQWTPTAPNGSPAAIAVDSRSTAASGGRAKSGDIRSAIAGSSSTTSCGEPGSASATALPRAVTCERTDRAATSNAISAGAPARSNATPSVTGPANDHLTVEPAIPDAAAWSRKARKPPKPSDARSVTTGASGSRRSRSTAMAPYWPSVIPGVPTTAWAINDSAGDRRGRLGIITSSFSRSENSAAARRVAMREAADARRRPREEPVERRRQSRQPRVGLRHLHLRSLSRDPPRVSRTPLDWSFVGPCGPALSAPGRRCASSWHGTCAGHDSGPATRRGRGKGDGRRAIDHVLP